MNTPDLCMGLMRADTEKEVVELLRVAGYWDADECWRPIGDVENNYATIGNQQGEAIAALAEKVINSTDARLTNACLLAGVDPEGDEAPTTIRKAVAQFFEGRPPDSEMGGRISEWLRTEVTKEGRLLTLAATGLRPGEGNPSITIADRGEGQTPDDFPNTFMSLARSNKQRIPFVQGKFNMGGTGALQFCGVKHGLQLVVSRRNPGLLPGSRSARDLHWGFTVVRRNPPPSGAKNSVFVYLAPHIGSTSSKRGVLSFPAECWPLFPESNSEVREAYYRNSHHGSLVKLYEYSFQGGRSHILQRDGLLRRLESVLPEMALPVRLYECRQGYKGHAGSFANNARGLVARLERNQANNLELEPWGNIVSFEGREIRLRFFVFRDGNAALYRRPKQAVVFTINGQMHGALPTDFFRRRSVGMSYLADSLLVLVDCSDIDGRMHEDLFMTSRDRLRDNPLYEKLTRILERCLGNDSKLKEMRNRRQADLTRRRLEDDKPLIEALESVLKSDPTLSTLLLQGLGIASPFPPGGGTGAGKRSEFVGKKFPSFFRFERRQTGEILERDAHKDSRVRIAFETDAVNDYFTRDIDPGMWSVQLNRDGQFVDASDWSATDPNSGVAQLWFDALPDESEVGEELEYVVTISDPNRVDGFENRLKLRVKGPQPASAGGKGRRRTATGGQGTAGGAGNLNLPKITTVARADWATYGFTEESVLRVNSAPTDQDDSHEQRSFAYDFFINIDNKYLRHEQKLNPQDNKLIEKQFTYGMVIVGLALLRKETKPADDTTKSSDIETGTIEEGEQLETRISETTMALAPVFLPMLKIIGNLVNEVL